ncbi:MAG: hypothetical protein GWP58_06265 [Gammaproteobacteria bacterium]|jgi:hypothetical protein|nr:hypothetical protein [Gammaproteobacteria bacterium]
MFDISIAIILAVVAIALVSWFLRFKTKSSENRMTRMMMHLGLNPDVTGQSDLENIIREVRRSCQKCQSEGVCERWLAGTESGPNDFCPNAQVFEELKKYQVGGQVTHTRHSDSGEIAAS